MEKMENIGVIKFFKEVSKIPRKSGEEEKIAEYLIKFAEKRNLEYDVDPYYNVIIRKNAKKGEEDREVLALQAHTDMICEKTDESMHDFSCDPIEIYEDGDFIKAKDTTLGADNGIGVAFLLAMLDNKEIKNPKLECIFTVQEETTMIGAIKLQMDKLKCKRIISLDNGKEGKVLVSSASCKEYVGKIEINREKSEADVYQLSYNNFRGGHSGGNIGDEKRGNPIKLAVEAIKGVEGIRLVDFMGGSRVNVIPRDACIIFTTTDQKAEKKIKEIIENQKKIFGEEVAIKLEKKNEKEMVLDEKTTNKVIEFVTEFQHGAIKKDDNGNVLQSGNLAAIQVKKEEVEIEFSERSNKKEYEKMYLQKLTEIINKSNMKIIWKQNLKGVEKRERNQLVNKCKEIYKKMYCSEMEEVISQGVVEGGFFVDKIPECEYMAIGPNTYDVHSPKERLSISSVQRTWNYIKEIVNNI